MKKVISVSVLLIICTLFLFGCVAPFYESLDAFGYISASGKTETIEGGKVILDEIDNMIELQTWYNTSGVPNNIVFISRPVEQKIILTFDISTELGSFWCWWQNEYVKSTTMNTYENNLMCWHPSDDTHGPDKPGESEVDEGDVTYIDIIVKVDKKIVGYAVIEVTGIDYVDHRAKLKKAVIYPKLDNKYQRITKYYISKEIEKAKV